MKKIIVMFFLLFSCSIYGQSLSVFDIDTSAFPTIKAKFFAFDSNGNQLTNLKISDFEVFENGKPRNTTLVSCPGAKPPQNVSLAMSFDISGSMRYSNFGEIPIELGKATANMLCNIVPLPPSEFALQTSNEKPMILQDFTTDKNTLLQKIPFINAGGGNNFPEQLLNKLTGLLNIAKNGKFKRVAVLFTDAFWFALTPDELQKCIDTCKKHNILFFGILYSKPEAEPLGIKSSLGALALATGGFIYDGILSLDAAKNIGYIIQQNSQGGEPCRIEWQSDISCSEEKRNVEIKLIQINTKVKESYFSPKSTIAFLEFNPTTLKFLNVKPGIKLDLPIKVTARNSGFIVTGIKSSNPAFYITPSSFTLTAGETINLTVSFVPVDSGYTMTEFTFYNNLCPVKYLASGGFQGRKPKNQTLNIIHPNGGDEFVVGSDSLITWEGVLPDDKVIIDYSTNNGDNWTIITDSATGLNYKWHIPNTPGKNCLARVTTKVPFSPICEDDEVRICNQIWKTCNLRVDRYRNGDPIPQVGDPKQWENYKTGAWCYYNNDPSNEQIYGKLYNWYAINDSRGLAPVGWHVASNAEWDTLINCLPNTIFSVGQLKGTGTLEGKNGLWRAPNTGATNETGFSAQPGGYRDAYGMFFRIEYYGYWWTSTQENSVETWCRSLVYNFAFIYQEYRNNNYGFSVRCLKD
ncbi:MAG: yiaD [Ignavibacteria bacterium]|nr:yiaD [Ignavibacteria bacterium]